jgi:HK97 family phage major capsid protein
MTLEKVTLTARTLGSYVKLSQELWQDSVNIGSMVETSLAQSLALELDRVALVGTGVAPQPQGLYGATGVQVYAQNGTLSYGAVSQAVQLIQTANHTPNAMIAHPRDYGIVDRLQDTTNQPLQPPQSYSNLMHLPSAQVPLLQGGSPEIGASAFVGDWREMLIGMRRELNIVVSAVASDGSESAFDKYQIWVAAWLRADIQLARPAAFCSIDELFAS